MKSDVISIHSDLRGTEEAMKAAEGFIRYNSFKRKNAMHVRLLTEELISMVHGIMDNFKGDLWFESDRNKDGSTLCRICLSAKRSADPKQEEQLLSVSTSGKNESAKGVLGKIREVFRVSAQYSDEGVFLSDYQTGPASWYSMGVMNNGVPTGYDMERCWSLRSYRKNLPEDHSAAAEEWDELEKSIIAKLADDVKVWLRNNSTEVVVEKKITE